MNVVLDIHRCSLNDGPGIRTTVFLKGCPLRCVWCHNPESQRHLPETDCLGKQWGREMSATEVMEVVLQDKAYYAASGGGMTLSGGEPLAQPDFALDLLIAAKERGIGTCLDTSGEAPQAVFEQTLPLTDVYLFDYKATGRDCHSALTGTSGKRILSNLEMLLCSGAQVILRCPLVPDVNDQPEHLKAIASLLKAHQHLQVNVLPYHRMGEGKAAKFAQTPTTFNVPPQTVLQAWNKQFKQLDADFSRLTILSN